MLVLPSDKEGFMRMAIVLAKKGIGKTSPNPMVGAVIVNDGAVVGKGFHHKRGKTHAEVNALQEAGAKAKGADIYINLEPCNHIGMTPPCTEKLIDRGIARAFIGMQDPNPVVSGKGIERLRDAGIEVEVGLLDDKCKRLNEAYIKYITTKTPFVTLKLASTLDGKIATFSGESRWITSTDSRKKVHKIRKLVDAIMIGVGTVLRDDPELTARPSHRSLKTARGKHPHRIIVDSKLRTPLKAKVLKQVPGSRIYIATTYKAPLKTVEKMRALGVNILFLPLLKDGVDLTKLMVELGRLEIVDLLIEGGTKLATSAVKMGVVDKLSLFFAPKILGGTKSVPMFLDLGVDSLANSFHLEEMRA
ncbi:MAG: bifunctional diaminohydroxyphosphoribosylaminopyrimidine deaminase/5-amino-6-(5-phosphoribosylamino)uracil reductase RibD [Thermodesulfobacteriota bacterium]